ncbi:MAG: alkaline phosphatase family protein [Bryobacterales bacterium]|jgi:predicted AlkP superfamily pyrophosphatase or phosphodiesterase|nr:alkaline phosphatase family protein [Bryobacterales bacterium]
MRTLLALFHLVALTAMIAVPPSHGQPAATARPPLPKPKLVLTVMVDQLRYDYLMRWNNEYRGGFRMLLDRGANFTDGHLGHYPSVTAIGHSALLTGAYPVNSGIVGNDWYDRESGKKVESITDFAETNHGAENDGAGASPRRMRVSTIGDQLKMAVTADPNAVSPVVIGVSLKDRGAILPAGHMADGAFWYDRQTGDFVSSTYYFKELPAWVQAFNARKLQDRYLGKNFECEGMAEPITKVPGTRGPMYYSSLWNTPYSNELIVEFGKAAVEQHRMGQRGAIDLLALSFSGNDSLGHRDGPDARSIREMTLATDRILGEFFTWLDAKVGMRNVLVVLSADHGVGPIPEVNQERNMPGGRLNRRSLFDPLEKALAARYGEGKWLVGTAGSAPYLNYTLLEEKQLNPAEVRAYAAAELMKVEGVARVFTRDQLLLGQAPSDEAAQRVLKSFHPKRSGDVEVLLEPYWIGDGSRATHGTPYSYDTHIPMVFMGPGIRAGYYDAKVLMQDIAPTLANLLEVEAPSGSEGRILHEMYAWEADRQHH